MKKVLAGLILCCVVAAPRAGAAPPDNPKMLDQYGDICCGDEKARLDSVAIALKEYPGATLYVNFYGGRRRKFPYCHSRRTVLSRRGEAETRAARIKIYLVAVRGVEEARVVMVNGGYREEWTADFWLVPTGAAAPCPSPTVDEKEIRFRRGNARPRDYYCGE